MTVANFEIKFPRRQALLSIRERRPLKSDGTLYGDYDVEYVEIGRAPVLVWPMPTQDGYFIVEHQDGHCQKVQPYELTFLGSTELFDQCDWGEE